MSFRRQLNRREWWLAVVDDGKELLREVPESALANEAAFRDYVTRGLHRGVRFSPCVFELSSAALDDLYSFINRVAKFDMDALLFDDFNEAFQRKLGAAPRLTED